MGKRARQPWYEFRAQTENADTAELKIFGPIGGGFFVDEDAVDGKSIAKQLDALPDSVKTIRVLVNSPGGSVFDGIHIANSLRRQREELGRNVVVDIEALAASAATLITSVGDPVRMPKNALMMIHNPWALGMGDAGVMRKLAQVLDKVRNTIIATYRWISDLSPDELGGLMDETTWMEADEALANGFITEVTDAIEAAASLDGDFLDHIPVPTEFRARVEAWVRPAKSMRKRSRTAPQAQAKSTSPPDDRENEDMDAAASAEETMKPKDNDPNATPDAKARAEAAKAERERMLGIQKAVQVGITAGLDPKEANAIEVAAIDAGDSVDQVREKIFEALANKSNATGPAPNAGHISPVPDEDERDKRVRGISAALYHRAGVTDLLRAAAKKRPDDPLFQNLVLDPGEFRGMSLLEHCREDLERRRPGSTRGRIKMQLAGDFFIYAAAAGQQTTSDFAVALEQALHKTLQAAYGTAPDTWRRFCRIGTVSDFRAHNRYYRSFMSRLDKILESGEFHNKAIPDVVKEVQQAATFGNILALSRTAIINDDMGVFSDIATTLGRAAALSIELEVYDTLKLNAGLGPAMNDGNTLFHANHNNVGTGAAIAVASLDADRVVLASQTDPSGNEVLDLRPATLVIPIGLGGAARVINEAQYDTEVSNKFQVPNKVVGLFRDIVDTPRLTGTRRYLFADPSIAPVLEVAFLEGEQQPFMDMQNGWRIDGVEWKVRHDFGVAAIDFRGAVTNAGA